MVELKSCLGPLNIEFFFCIILESTCFLFPLRMQLYIIIKKSEQKPHHLTEFQMAIFHENLIENLLLNIEVSIFIYFWF